MIGTTDSIFVSEEKSSKGQEQYSDKWLKSIRVRHPWENDRRHKIPEKQIKGMNRDDNVHCIDFVESRRLSFPVSSRRRKWVKEGNKVLLLHPVHWFNSRYTEKRMTERMRSRKRRTWYKEDAIDDTKYLPWSSRQSSVCLYFLFVHFHPLLSVLLLREEEERHK